MPCTSSGGGGGGDGGGGGGGGGGDARWPSDEPYLFDFSGWFEASDGARALAGELRTGAADEVLHLARGARLARGGDAGEREPPLGLVVGPDGTGIPFHYHAESWLELVAGEKRWWLVPPEPAVSAAAKARAAAAAAPGNASADGSGGGGVGDGDGGDGDGAARPQLDVDITLPHAEWIARALAGDVDAPPPPGVCALTQRPGEIVYVERILASPPPLPSSTRFSAS